MAKEGLCVMQWQGAAWGQWGSRRGYICVCVSMLAACVSSSSGTLFKVSEFQWKMVHPLVSHHVITLDMRFDLDSCLPEESHLCDMI